MTPHTPKDANLAKRLPICHKHRQNDIDALSHWQAISMPIPVLYKEQKKINNYNKNIPTRATHPRAYREPPLSHPPYQHPTDVDYFCSYSFFAVINRERLFSSYTHSERLSSVSKRTRPISACWPPVQCVIWTRSSAIRSAGCDDAMRLISIAPIAPTGPIASFRVWV